MATDSYLIRPSVGGLFITIAAPALAYAGVVSAAFEEGLRILFIAATALLVGIVARALRVSATVDATAVTVHNFWKTTRVAWTEVEQVTCSESFRSFLRISPAAVGLRLKGFENQTWETLENTLTVKATIAHEREKRVEIIGVLRHFAEMNGVPCNLTEDHIKRAFTGCREYP